jgi:hypothetical protein
LPILQKNEKGFEILFSLSANSERIGVQLTSGRKVCVKPINIPVVLRMIPGKGFGLIATRKFYNEDIIFTENPFLKGPNFSNNHGVDEWLFRIRSISEEKYAQLCRLSSSVSQTCEMQLRMKIGNGEGYSKDEFEKANRMLRIFEVNCFNCGNHREIHFAASHFNHSCIPNAVRERPEGKFTIQAIGEIQPGDEICITYVTKLFLKSTTERKMALKYGPWGFDCCCELCQRGSGSENGQEVYDSVMNEIMSGRRDSERLNELLEEMKEWMTENYPHAYGEFIIEDLKNGIMGSLMGLI